MPLVAWLTNLAGVIALSGCLATTTSDGGVRAGSAGGATEGASSNLEKCTEPLGTVSIDEQTNAPWYGQYMSRYQTGSTVPALRLLIQQSNCFVLVDRGRGLAARTREMELMRGAEGRAGSNIGGGQVVAADYTLMPEVMLSDRGGSAGSGRLTPGAFAAVAGSVSSNEAGTMLTLVDNRSAVQLTAAEGYSKNMDPGAVGTQIGGAGAGGGVYTSTAQGKVLMAAFTDSFNRTVATLRAQKSQAVKAGLGTGGTLGTRARPSSASNGFPAPQTLAMSRFVNFDAPTFARPAQSIAVQVWLSEILQTPEATLRGPTGQQIERGGKLPLALPKDRERWGIDVVLIAPGFDFVGHSSNKATLTLEKQEDSTPALFTLQARSGETGKRQLRATLWHEGAFLGSVGREIEIGEPSRNDDVSDQTKGSEGRSTTASLPQMLAKGAQPTGTSQPVRTNKAQQSYERVPFPSVPVATADLTIFIRHDDPRTLGRALVVLASPYLKGVALEEVDFPPDAEQWLAAWIDRLQRLTAPKTESDIQSNVANARGFGQDLYKKLAPKLLKRTLSDLLISKPSGGITLQIYSNNPTIPWELMRPGIIGDQEIDFFGTAFKVARWHVAGSEKAAERPMQSLRVKESVIIAPEYAGATRLLAQKDEIAFLSRLKGFRRTPGTFDAMRKLAKNPPAGIVHFAGHGQLSGFEPTRRRYRLRLEDNMLDAVGWLGFPRSPKSEPSLYFFNACDLGITESQVGEVSGWAPAVLDSGASGFIGGLWSLDDGHASQFAIRFYEKLAASTEAPWEMSVAEAMRHARNLFFETGESTYLAYVFYGDVNLKLAAP